MKLFSTKKPLKILFVAAEAEPFVKVGGLGSVMYSLPKALSRLGHDTRLMLPRYLSIDNKKFDLKLEYKGLKVPTGNVGDGPEELVCNVKKYDPASSNDDDDLPVTSYFLENEEYYEQRANVYGYADDTIRWALLCRGTLEFIRSKTGWTPDVIVSCDWQAGLIPNYMRTEYAEDPVISKIASVFSIHNLTFQGMFDHKFVQEMDFDDGHSAIPGFNQPRLGKINWMRRGIMYADYVNTVSPNYAREIMTPEFGELLDDLLRERRAFLTGILNGIDYGLWDTENDPYINNQYSVNNLDERQKNRTVLQERFGLPIDKNAFIACIISRLNKQKGFDLLFPILKNLIQELPIQLIVVGEGESDIMGFFNELEKEYPSKVATHLKFDKVLPHIVLAGADVILVPSKFEPCGLVQMEAMRMGTIPIVRKTGGLADSVEDYNPDKATGSGFVFEKYDSSSLMIAFIRAFENFRDKKKWKELMKRAMQKDFSWDNSAKKYSELFVRAVEFRYRQKKL